MIVSTIGVGAPWMSGYGVRLVINNPSPLCLNPIRNRRNFTFEETVQLSFDLCKELKQNKAFTFIFAGALHHTISQGHLETFPVLMVEDKPRHTPG